MTDIFSVEKRSQIMRHIKSKDSKPEKYIRSLVHSMGYRFRLHRKDLPGCPDLVFPKYRKVIFVHGCFWHGHKGCKRSTLPHTNYTFWKDKIEGNIKRDKTNYHKLRNINWKYLVIWQCEIKIKYKKELINKLSNFLQA
jgi:DNA mismatch endonuclease (patch repair protein)